MSIHSNFGSNVQPFSFVVIWISDGWLEKRVLMHCFFNVYVQSF